MPILFVSTVVGIVENWALIQPQLLGIFLLLLSTTIATFGISGGLTQLCIRKGGEAHD